MPPAGAGLKTVIDFPPAFWRRDPGMYALSCVVPMNVVESDVPSSLTTEEFPNFAPVTEMVSPDDNVETTPGETDEISGVG